MDGIGSHSDYVFYVWRFLKQSARTLCILQSGLSNRPNGLSPSGLLLAKSSYYTNPNVRFAWNSGEAEGRELYAALDFFIDRLGECLGNILFSDCRHPT